MGNDWPFPIPKTIKIKCQRNTTDLLDELCFNPKIKFHNLYIPVDRMLKPDLPAAINVGNHVQRLKSVDSDVQVMQLLKVEISGMKEEISYVGEYIKQGNTERVRGNNKLISTIENNKTDGY